jgi:predicted GNAT family acetyltransferase
MEISTDRARLNLTMIHAFLSQESTWALGIPLEKVRTAINNSLCFGVYIDEVQVAFARIVSDYATYAYLMDVFVLPAHRGLGYSTALMDAIMAHPDLQGLRRFMLATTTARGIYERYGFQSPAKPEALMEINVPDIYQRSLSKN